MRCAAWIVAAALAAAAAEAAQLPANTNEIKTLTVEQAKAVPLNGLTTLSDRAAKALSQYDQTLFLSGLTTLSDAAVEAFCQRRATVFLKGLTTVSDEGAAMLRAHEDVISCPKVPRRDSGPSASSTSPSSPPVEQRERRAPRRGVKVEK